jgi:ankyrin repeat protein
MSTSVETNESKLVLALLNGNTSVVQDLLKQGIDANAKTEDDGYALPAISLGGHKRIVELLLKKGAGVNA